MLRSQFLRCRSRSNWVEANENGCEANWSPGLAPNTNLLEFDVAAPAGANRLVVDMTWDGAAADADADRDHLRSRIPNHRPALPNSEPAAQTAITITTTAGTSNLDLGCSVSDIPQAPSSDVQQKRSSPLSSSVMSLEATI